jgi:acetyl esterase
MISNRVRGTPMQRRYGQIDPALEAVYAALAEKGLVSPDPAVMPIAEARAGNERYLKHLGHGAPAMAAITLREIPGPGGAVPVKILRPEAADIPAPAVLFLHGGGFTFGDLETHEGLAATLAAESGAVVVMPHYRRTPEHPFPAAWEDSLAAWTWLTRAETVAELGLDHRRLGMAGDSAGGNLALSLAAALRDGAGPVPAAAALIYGMFSRRTDTVSHRTYAAGPGLTAARLAWFWEQYLPGGQGADDARAVPWLATLEGLPPLSLFIAECDILADDTWDLLPRLEAAGVPATLDVFENATHGFIALSRLYAPAADAMATIGRRIAETLGAPRLSA